MAKIAIDIDSTLYDFEDAAREAMLKLYQDTGDPAYKRGAYHPWTEWRSPADAMTDDSGSIHRWLEAIDICHRPEVILAQKPFNGAVETCQALLGEGHDLLYISNRAEASEEATVQWLKNEGFLALGATGDPLPWTSVVCTSGDKRPFMNDCQFIIDDRLKTAVQFVYDHDWHYEYVELGIREGERMAFVKGYEYNQAGTDIPGLYIAMTWAGLNEYLHSKGVLTGEAYKALEAVA